MHYFSFVYFTLLSSSVHITICSISVLYVSLFCPSSPHIGIYIILFFYILLCFSRLCILTSAVFQFCIFDFAFLFSAYWHLHYFSSVYLTFFPRLCILTVALFQFCIFYFAFVVCAYYHLQYFSSVCFTFLSLVSAYWHLHYFIFLYFTLLFSSLHIDICSISVLHNLLCFLCLSFLTSAVFRFCRFYFAFFVSAYWQMQYISSVYFTLLSTSLNIGIWSISFLDVLLYFLRFCILTPTVFQFWIFYFSFFVPAYWHVQYISSVYFTLLSTSLNIGICSISVLYILRCYPHPCILASAVFAFWIFEFSFLVSAYWQLQYLSSIYLTLLASAFHIGICSMSILCISLCFPRLYILICICSISFLYILLCIPHLCILTSPVFQFCIFNFAFLVYAYWHL